MTKIGVIGVEPNNKNKAIHLFEKVPTVLS
jgi:hypothetical protein